MKKVYAQKSGFFFCQFLMIVFLVGGISMCGWGQISESFETGLPTTYSETTSYELSSGIWTGSADQVKQSTDGVTDGNYSCQLRSQTGSQITTPTLSDGVGTISFYVSASTDNGGLQIKLSTDNGANWEQVSGSPISFGTNTSSMTFDVNNPSVNKVQFYRTGVTVYIDEVEITKADEAPTKGYVFISEVADSENHTNEYLELFNNSDKTITLTETKLLMIKDDETTETGWDFSDFGSPTIPPFNFLIITRGGNINDFEDAFGALGDNTVFVKGSEQMYFGTGTTRRWQIWNRGTSEVADGDLIDDTQETVAGDNNRTYQNIFDSTFITDDKANAKPGELDYLLYNEGLWINNLQIDANTANDDALIYDHLIISVNSEINNLYINSEAQVAISSGYSLDVNGSLTNNAGNSGLVIQSDNTGTGSLIHNTPGVKAAVQYYMPESTGDWPENKDERSTDWYYIASPVVGQDIDPFFEDYDGQYDLYR